MDTWNDFIALVNRKLAASLPIIYDEHLGLNLITTGVFLEECMGEHLGENPSPFGFRPANRGTACPAPRTRLEVLHPELSYIPYRKDTKTEHFSAWEHVAYLQNQPMVTVRVEARKRGEMVVSCVLSGFDPFTMGIQSVTNSFRNTDIYAQSFWNKEIVPLVEALEADVDDLGRDRIQRLLWSMNLLQQYAGSSIQQSAPEAAMEQQGSRPMVDLLDAAVLTDIQKSQIGRTEPIMSTKVSSAPYRPQLTLWSSEEEAAFYKAISRRSGRWANYVVEVIREGVVPLLKRYVVDADFPPVLSSLFVYAKVLGCNERWVTLIGSDELLDNILPGAQPKILPYGTERRSLAAIQSTIDAMRESNPNNAIVISFNITADGLAGFPVEPIAMRIKPKSLLAGLKRP